MMHSDATTFDLGQTCLRLKDGLGFSIQQGRNQCWYLIEDDSRTQFYRIGPAEYTFVSLLDGKTTMSSAMATTCSLMGSTALDEQEAINLCKWLIDSGLAHTSASTSAHRMRERSESQQARQRMQNFNPVSIKFPLVELDRIATTANRYLGWLFSWPVALVWLMACTYGFLSLAANWDRIGEANVFSRDNMLWMTVTWLLLKLVHELAHVLACKRFGGRVGKGGILFLLLIPMPFVDVTSAWRFPSKYRRILVSAAGMLAEIFIAAVAAIIWADSPPGLVAFHCANVMVAASLHTLLFNANPLMRFDGYHILADWCEIPNLGNHGQQWIRGLGRKVFFGSPAKRMEYAGFHGQLIKAYGIGACIWKIFISITLTIGAANLFSGVGLLIALGSMALWLALPTYQLMRYIILGTEFETPNRRHFAMVVGLMLIAILTAGSLTPAPSVITAPCIVDYRGREIVRSEAQGFVDQVHVADRQIVEKGDLLVTLENRDYVARQIRTLSDIRKSELRSHRLLSEGDVGGWQAEQAALEALTQQLREVQANLTKLEIRAPASGMVVASQLKQAEGIMVHPGDELLSIGRSAEKEAIAMVSQYDAHYLRQRTGEPAALRVAGRTGAISAVFEQISPSAQDSLPHFAFAGAYGGPLEVISRSQVEGGNAPDEQADLMITQPRVEVRLRLDEDASLSLAAGQPATAHLDGRSETLTSYVVSKTGRWLQSKLTQTHGL